MIVEREHESPNKLSYKNTTLAFPLFFFTIDKKQTKIHIKNYVCWYNKTTIFLHIK